LRNRFNSAALGLHYLQRMLETSRLDDAEETVLKVFNELKVIEREIEVAPDRDPAPSQSSSQSRPTPRALLVEDNDNERELLAGYLRLSGVQVETAVDGLQAMIRLSQNSPPDFVLLDMRMPRFDGRKTVSAIRNNPDYRGVKLFAVTGTAQADMNVHVGPKGVDRWFSKPLNAQHLIAALREDMHSESIST
jgi:CheY-like chemotaxis protein